MNNKMINSNNNITYPKIIWVNHPNFSEIEILTEFYRQVSPCVFCHANIDFNQYATYVLYKLYKCIIL